jgi:hypothetical protein
VSIKYSKHIKIRLALRNIAYDLPRQIFEGATERFTDSETGHTIAVGKAWLYEKERNVMVAYTLEGEDVRLLTIHPLQEGQKENRIKSGRWRKIS